MRPRTNCINANKGTNNETVIAYSADLSTVYVRARTTALADGGDELEVCNVVVHEDFDKYVLLNDIALIKVRAGATERARSELLKGLKAHLFRATLFSLPLSLLTSSLPPPPPTRRKGTFITRVGRQEILLRFSWFDTVNRAATQSLWTTISSNDRTSFEETY